MVMLATEDLTEQVHLHPGKLQRPCPHADRDEYTVDFDRCMLIYSDRMSCGTTELGRVSPITALMLGNTTEPQGTESARTGETAVGCYQGDRFVGSINFYSNPEDAPRSNTDPEGRVHLWFPLPCFPHILGILRHEKKLSLCLIYRDLRGSDLMHPLGALLTWPEPTGKEVDALS